MSKGDIFSIGFILGFIICTVMILVVSDGTFGQR